MKLVSEFEGSERNESPVPHQQHGDCSLFEVTGLDCKRSINMYEIY